MGKLRILGVVRPWGSRDEMRIEHWPGSWETWAHPVLPVLFGLQFSLSLKWRP